MFLRILAVCIAMTSLGLAANAQQASIALSGKAHDTSLPVEVTADSLDVSQQAGTAIFRGNAKAGQGDLRLEAATITVKYNNEATAIEKLEAVGNVAFTNGAEVAEAGRAVFIVATRMITLTGDVVLVQGQNAISGDKLLLDLTTNRGSVSGNVKTIFIPKQ